MKIHPIPLGVGNCYLLEGERCVFVDGGAFPDDARGSPAADVADLLGQPGRRRQPRYERRRSVPPSLLLAADHEFGRRTLPKGRNKQQLKRI